MLFTTATGSSFHRSLKHYAETTPHAEALLGVDGASFSYKSLYERLKDTALEIRSRGVRPDDCIVMVVPEGPIAAMCFLSISAVARCAPLNPSYSKSDFAFYFDDLKPQAVVIPKGFDTPVVAIAQAAGIPVWCIEGPGCNAPDHFCLHGMVPGDASEILPIPADDSIALILHTSGTTSRPKMVPLTHLNLSTSAQNIANMLELKESDRSLNVMPLFHIHGLMGGLLSTLWAGGSILCAPGFKGEAFLGWAITYKVNWYSAVPTIHQAVLEQAKSEPERAGQLALRFIRSSSAPLPPAVFHEMQSFWKTPVVESYGMTEASHQMASNCLPPGQRKPGSVGIAAGPEISIMDEEGHLLKQGETGEIVIRGKQVTGGYLANPNANRNAFTNGWFRTGDQGRFDEDGYLYLTGRLKEMIIRGGENIAPKEIDEALIEHAAVAQAIAFAVPHATLSEDLAAAVVLVKGQSVSELQLRSFLMERLASFKVPSRIVFVDNIPKGSTGKLQRMGLFEKLKAYFEASYEPPVGAMETIVATAFSLVLGIDSVGRLDNFFYLGGDSLKAQRVLKHLRKQCHFEIPAGTLFRYPNPSILAVELSRLRDSDNELEDLAEQLKSFPLDELEKLLNE